jgi:hypothetical protein
LARRLYFKFTMGRSWNLYRILVEPVSIASAARSVAPPPLCSATRATAGWLLAGCCGSHGCGVAFKRPAGWFSGPSPVPAQPHIFHNVHSSTLYQAPRGPTHDGWDLHRQGCFLAHISCNINFGGKSKGSLVNQHSSRKFLTTFHVTPTKTVFYGWHGSRQPAGAGAGRSWQQQQPAARGSRPWGSLAP